jgi:hypothetical protein
MASKKHKICKQAAAGTTSHITLTILETHETIMKPGNATFQSVIMAAYEIGSLANCGKRNNLLQDMKSMCTYVTLPSCAQVSESFADILPTKTLTPN